MENVFFCYSLVLHTPCRRPPSETQIQPSFQSFLLWSLYVPAAHLWMLLLAEAARLKERTSKPSGQMSPLGSENSLRSNSPSAHSFPLTVSACQSTPSHIFSSLPREMRLTRRRPKGICSLHHPCIIWTAAHHVKQKGVRFLGCPLPVVCTSLPVETFHKPAYLNKQFSSLAGRHHV